MANTIPSAQILPVAVVVAKALRESAGILGQVQRDFENLENEKGETINIGLSAPLAAATVTPAAVPTIPSDHVWQNRAISLSDWKKGNFYLTSREMAKVQSGNWIPDQIQQAVRTVTNAMRTSVYTACKKFDGYVKTAQSQFYNSTDNIANAVTARKILNMQLCPRMDRVAMICNDEEASALGLSQFLEAAKSGDQSNVAFREGFIGRVMGMEHHGEDTTDIPYVHTAGTGASYVLDGAHAVGAVTLTLKTGSGTVLVNDIVKIGSHYYAVVTGCAAAGDIVIGAPGLRAAGADGATVTVQDASGTHDVQGYAFNPRGIVLAGRVPNVEGSLGQHQIVRDPVTGIIVKLSRIPAYEAVIWEVSALWGAGIADPRYGCRMASA
jgi:hypothetical protein